MLSILIPVYNYNVSNLVEEIHKQAINSKIDFEIICFEDGSNQFVLENKLCTERLSHASILISKTNIGRTNSRHILAKTAAFSWLLFLDSDVMPKASNFIKKYKKNISSGNDTLYGGLAYINSKPEPNYMLRWKYGKTFEEVDALKRNTNPYKAIASGNFLIKKDVFIKINSKIKRKSYGSDNYFGILLKQENIKVRHLNNQVFHLGLDKSEIYLTKTEESIETLLWLFEKNKYFDHENKLINVFCLLKKYKLNFIVSYVFKNLSPIMKKNITGSNPNITVFQFYKIGYMCYKDLN